MFFTNFVTGLHKFFVKFLSKNELTTIFAETIYRYFDGLIRCVRRGGKVNNMGDMKGEIGKIMGGVHSRREKLPLDVNFCLPNLSIAADLSDQ